MVMHKQTNHDQVNKKLGGDFKHFLFSSLPGEMVLKFTNIFQMG